MNSAKEKTLQVDLGLFNQVRRRGMFMTKKFATKVTFVLVLLAAVIIICSAPIMSTIHGMEKGKRPTISAGDRAEAMWAVQNVMSKHAYYKQINKHCDEMADIWVSEGSQYDKTATWTSKYGVEVGLTQIKLNYCTACIEDMKKKLEEVSKTYPAIKNTQENIGVGYMYFMHTNLTPVIEVAGDGKTAKGIWYSLGVSMSPDIDSSGKVSVRGHWQPEKYAVDFVKEGDRWKIWHFVNIFEPGPDDKQYGVPSNHGAMGTIPGQKTSAAEPTEEHERDAFLGASSDQKASPMSADQKAPPKGGGITHYVSKTIPGLYAWDPKKVPQIYPKFPEPYYTFSETFSY
jgi:hypothetical protein